MAERAGSRQRWLRLVVGYLLALAPSGSGRAHVLVGGLQRSGTTTLAALLVNASGAAPLAVENFPGGQAALDARAPWDQPNVLEELMGRQFPGRAAKPLSPKERRARWTRIVQAGGLEGKLVQTVYPAVKSFWHWTQSNRSELLPQLPKPTPALRRQLLADWEEFWPADAEAVLEKTPENILMIPFLSELLGSAVVFVVAIRHPLAWALAVAKWWGRQSLPVMIEYWLTVHEALLNQLDRDPSGLGAQVRIVRTDVSNCDDSLHLGLHVCGHNNPDSGAVGRLAPYYMAGRGDKARLFNHTVKAGRMFDAVAASNRKYFDCFVAGRAYDGKADGCVVTRMADLSTTVMQNLRVVFPFETRANAFGYSFKYHRSVGPGAL